MDSRTGTPNHINVTLVSRAIPHTDVQLLLIDWLRELLEVSIVSNKWNISTPPKPPPSEICWHDSNNTLKPTMKPSFAHKTHTHKQTHTDSHVSPLLDLTKAVRIAFFFPVTISHVHMCTGIQIRSRAMNTVRFRGMPWALTLLNNLSQREKKKKKISEILIASYRCSTSMTAGLLCAWAKPLIWLCHVFLLC